MNYRKVKFKFVEWTTWDGKYASGYHCEDKKLLEGLNTVSFGTKTINEMQDLIDDYVDNKKEKLNNQYLYDQAEAEFMMTYGTQNAD